MPIDEWLILAYVMIFSSVILCAFLPMILRLRNDRQRFHRYELERQAIEYACLHALFTSKSIYNDMQIDISDLSNDIHPDFRRMVSNEQSILYTQIPFIDDNDDTSV